MLKIELSFRTFKSSCKYKVDAQNVVSTNQMFNYFMAIIIISKPFNKLQLCQRSFCYD